MITVFFVIIVGIPVLIWKTWQHKRAKGGNARTGGSFDAWASQRFATWTGALSGREAATQILLPIAAVSIGMFSSAWCSISDVPHAGS